MGLLQCLDKMAPAAHLATVAFETDYHLGDFYLIRPHGCAPGPKFCKLIKALSSIAYPGNWTKERNIRSLLINF